MSEDVPHAVSGFELSIAHLIQRLRHNLDGDGACRLFDANFDRRAELLHRLELSGDAAD